LSSSQGCNRVRRRFLVDGNARLEREATLLATLDHANIVHVFGSESPTLRDGPVGRFLVMKRVEGGTPPSGGWAGPVNRAIAEPWR
jgi:hypothetical protein